MALSSDEIIKRECIDLVKRPAGIKLRVFPESSNEDQKPFSTGGLTFGYDNVLYGSCDACWYVEEDWIDGYNNTTYSKKPVIALEGTDALNRRSSGNAQYQRFHHVLGAVKNGLVGIYYLRKGVHKIQEDLFGMAYNASMVEKGTYIITDDLKVVEELLDEYSNEKIFAKLLKKQLDIMKSKFDTKFNNLYDGSWDKFADRRSSVLSDGKIIKMSGRMKRNFTDGSQRAGHIAVGEMLLTKYFFPNRNFYYLWPKMSKKDTDELNRTKATDKEWYLLSNEPGVTIITRDDLIGLSDAHYKKLEDIADLPLIGSVLREFNIITTDIKSGLKNGRIKVKADLINE